MDDRWFGLGDRCRYPAQVKTHMRFNLKHLLAITAIIGLLLAAAMIVFSPFIELASSINAAQNRIINEFDHALIRDSTFPLLKNSAERFVEPEDWPPTVAETEPKSIYVANGQVFIEYGGGFAHYGLIIDPNNQRQADRTKLTDGVYFYETEW